MSGGDGDDWLTSGEAAGLMGVHRDSLKRNYSREELPYEVTRGGHRRYRRRHVLAVIEADRERRDGSGEGREES